MQALQMFGYAEDELVGQDVAVLMPSPYREQHGNYIQRYIESGQPKVLGASRIVEALHKEGYVMSLRFSLSEAKSQVRSSACSRCFRLYSLNCSFCGHQQHNHASHFV